MADFMVDIKGRINNTPLPDYKYLWPLFESVVNSIQSVEDSAITDGRIEIYAERQNYAQIALDLREARVAGVEMKPEITSFFSFSITDNGHGFTSDNYKSFRTADSSLKWKKGCKGIGRFLWLKAFEKAHIESNYQENNGWHKRIFDFTMDGIKPDENISDSDISENKTTVILEDFKSSYREKCPKSLDILARKIIEHCLIYFLSGKCPQIIIKDSMGESVNLNQYYESNIKDSLHQDHFNIDGNEFVIYHVKIHEGANAHELHLCANEREVRSINLDRLYPNLQRKILDETETGFFYCGYLTGAYLDSRVNISRTGFEFADEYQMDIVNDIPEKGLIDAAKSFIFAYLQEYIDEINIRKEKRVNDFVAHKQPQYRLLLNQRPNALNDIKPDLSDKELELALHAEVLKWDMDAKQRGVDIKSNMANDGVPEDEFMPRFEAYCKEVTAISKISLSEYIIRRKVILDLLEAAIEVKADGSYSNESQIHSIVCPMRYTSDEIGFEEMNLWIVNERLAYHNFLASDKPMRELPQIESQSKTRMDIAIFDEPLSFADKDSSFNTLTIIEFKRPNRDGLNKTDSDPIRQVLRYVQEIKDGKKRTAKGRPFGSVQNTAFYCYVIADLTDSMVESAKVSGLTVAPDGDGYFGYIPGFGAYVEVISYNKLLKDAKERNQVLFDKLFKASSREIIALLPDNNIARQDEISGKPILQNRE
jgi:hypothetical protein